MIVVIADDITGAAEIAGTALRYGLQTVLTTNEAVTLPDVDVAVIATDTRSESEEKAKSIVKLITMHTAKNGNVLFKKTDSVLRGHIVAELKAIVETANLRNALLIAQNPSKGRIITNGTYYVNGVKLEETAFRQDPEFPALSSNVKTLLKNEVRVLKLDDNTLQDNTIYVAEATNEDDIKRQVNKTNRQTLLAGGADLFNVLLQMKYGKEASYQQNMSLPLTEKRSIIICGSTQSKNIANEPYIKAAKSHEEIMPDDVFNGSPHNNWITHLSAQYVANKSVIISLGQRPNAGKACALRLKKIIAEAVECLVRTTPPDLMIIEGGATAYSILRCLKWNVLKLHAEYAPGIVSMTHGKTEIILKPGSYSWGKLFKSS